MRIIGGKYRGRRLISPDDRHIRPTSDRLRESLFNMIQHGPYPDLDGARVLDMFAGTGAFGLEALSRGAAHVTFLDTDRRSLKLIHQNVDLLNGKEITTIECANATKPFSNIGNFDIIFLDPPYKKDLLGPTLQNIQLQGLASPESLIITESSKDEDIVFNEFFKIIIQKNIGSSQICFLEKTA